ncbi:hypothetical protein KCU68_g8734, partial [Aureobasidium melanogenum]
MNMSHAIMGLTIFAVGNSLGDLVADITVARLGYPIMALSACLGGPMLNILLGIGLSGSWILIRGAEHRHAKHPGKPIHFRTYEIQVGQTLIVSGVTLLVTLIGLLIAVPLNKWVLSRKIGWVLIGLWCISTTINVVLEVLGIGESGSEEKRSMAVGFGSRANFSAYSSTGSQPHSYHDDVDDRSYDHSDYDPHDHPGAYSTLTSSESDISPNDSASIPAARTSSHARYQSHPHLHPPHPPSHERSRQERPPRKTRQRRPPAEYYSQPEPGRHSTYPEHISTPSDPSELSARMPNHYDHPAAYSARTSYHEGQHEGLYAEPHWPGQHAHYPHTMTSSTSSTSHYTNPAALAPYDYAYAGQAQYYAAQASAGNPFITAPPHAPSPQPGYTYDSYTGIYHQQRPEMLPRNSMAYLTPEMQYPGYPPRPYSVPQNMMQAMIPPGYPHLYQPHASPPVPDEKPAKAEKKEEPPPAPPAPPPPTAEEIKKKMEEEAALQAENLVKALKALQADEKAAAAAAAEQQSKAQAESDKIATLLADFEKQRLAREEAAAAKAAKEKAEAEAKAAREKELADAATAARENAEKEAAAAAALAKAENEKAIAEAKAEHEKKMAEAKAAADAAEAAKKAAEEELKKNAPAPDADKAPLKFTDAVDRSFTLPWHLVKTWKGMETLIRQAFVNIERIGPHVANGHYHLLGPNNEIILPQVWDVVVQPGWDIKMQLWPLPPDPEEKPIIGIGGFGPDIHSVVQEPRPIKPKQGRTQVSGNKSAGKRASVGPAPPPPPPAPVQLASPPPPPVHMPTVLPGHDNLDDPIIQIVEDSGKTGGGGGHKPRNGANGGKKKQVPAFTRWMLGGTTRPRPKGAEKPAAGVKSMDLPKLSVATHSTLTFPGERMEQSPASTGRSMVSSACAVNNLDITSPSSMDFIKSSAAKHPIKASSGEHTEKSPTSTDGSKTSSAVSAAGSDPNHPSSPDFNNLPVELKKMVVHHAEDSCLPNLRLVNKELNAIATKPFGERLLAERRFMLSEYSLQGLIDLSAHPDLGPCVRKVLLNTHGFTEKIGEWPKVIGKHMSKTECRAVWKRIRVAKHESTDFVETPEVVDLLSQALSNLKKHGQRVTLGIFDDVVYGPEPEDDILRKSYGFDKLWGDISPLDELTPDHWYAQGEITFDILLEALTQSESYFPSLELDLASALRNPRSDLDQSLHLAVTAKDGKIPPDLDICIKAGLDWTFWFFRRDDVHDDLVFEYEGTTIEVCGEDEVDPDFLPEVIHSFPSEPRYDYGSGTCSLYSRCVLGRFNFTLSSENMTEIRISSCATEAHFLVYGICALGKAKLEKLVLTDLHLFGPGSRGFVDEKNKAWPWIEGFLDLIGDNCPNLRSLKMGRVFFHAEDKPGRAVIVEKHRSWEGVDGVLTGLVSLISEMTTLDAEQRKLWHEGKIDSDGHALTDNSEQ